MSALPKYVSQYRDRHGHTRRRFRRTGFLPANLKEDPGTEEFEREYAQCLRTVAEPKPEPPYREPSSLPFQLAVFLTSGFDAKQPCVYFVQAHVAGLVKIGLSACISDRFKQLQTASPVPLMLLGVFPGTAQDERFLHGHFAGQRVRGEWFNPSPELLEIASNGWRTKPNLLP